MAIINKHSLSEDDLKGAFFKEIGYPLVNYCDIKYEDGVIKLIQNSNLSIYTKGDFNFNYFYLDMDKWEENGYPKEIIFESHPLLRFNIFLKGNDIQNYTFIGTRMTLLLSRKQKFEYNDLSGSKGLCLFIYPENFKDSVIRGFRNDGINRYGYLFEDDLNYYTNPFLNNTYKSKYDDIYGYYN